MWGDTECDGDLDVAVDSTDQLYVAGFTRNFESGFGDIYLAKFSSSGTRLWYTLWDSGCQDNFLDIFVDKTTDDLYLAGKSKAFSLDSEDMLLIIKNPTFPEYGSGNTQADSTIPGYEMFLIISVTSIIAMLIITRKRAKVRRST